MKYNEDILTKVRIYEEKRGINYAKTDGKLYKTLKVLYVLMFAYTMVINLLYILGTLLLEDLSTVQKNILYTVSALCVSLVVSLIVMRFKKYLWANIAYTVLNILSCVGLCVTFGVISADPVGFLGFLPLFYYRHFAPLLIMTVLTVWLFVIALNSFIKTRKCYNTILENLYNSTETDINSLEWEKIVEEK